MQTTTEQVPPEQPSAAHAPAEPAPPKSLPDAPAASGEPAPALKYDHRLEFRSENNSHVQLLARVPAGVRVLELGCATGYMSAHLVERKGCEVVGVDLDAPSLAKAAAHCTRTLCADVEAPDWQAPLGDARFDVVLCADIIEHLKDPEAFLAGLRPRIVEGGRLLASVPNGAHASIRLELLHGQFTYEDTGLLDRTHLHLFTHQSLMALLARAGYVVEELSYTFHDIPDPVLEEQLARVGLAASPAALARLHAPEAIAYQFIVSARPRGADEVAPPYPELHDKPLRDSEEAYRKVHERLHQAQVAAQRRQEVIEARDRQLAHLQHQVEARSRRIDALTRGQGELTRANQELRRHNQDQARRLAAKDGRIGELQQQARALDGRVTALLVDKARLLDETARLRTEVTRQRAAVARLRATLKQLHERHRALQQVLSTRSWRLFRALTLPLRAVARLAPHGAYLIRHPGVAPRWFAKALRLWRQGGLRGLRWHLAAAGQAQSAPRGFSYQRWIQECEAPTEPTPQAVQAFLAGLAEPPRISIVMPVYEPRLEWLRAALESVRAQSYPHWQLCVADDASPSAAVRELLAEFAAADPRIRVTLREHNGHIAAATNSALALAEGEWVAFMDHDDLLAPHALYHVARELTARPETRLLYSDEDKIDARGVRSAHYFKPDYNPDLMLSHNLLCHFSVYRRALVEAVGGVREGYDGAQDYDLALRCLATLEPREVRHLPRILYHWRAVSGSTAAGLEAKPYALDAAVRAVADHLATQGVVAEVGPSPRIDGMLRVRYPLPDPAPRVSLIIPTRNGLRLLRQCIDSVRARTDYPDYDILVVDNQSDDPATREYLAELAASGQARVVPYDAPFNYAAINNFAVAEAGGDYLCFLNNDIEVIDGGWLREMVSQAARPAIGAVGARLLYPDGRLQHGGVITGLGGVAGHAMKYLSGEAKGYNGRAVLVQNYSAVTAACMVVRRAVFDEVGGFDAEHLGVAFNDVDLCLRIRERGYRNLWTPHAELYHHESATRGAENTAEKQARFSAEIAYMKSRWGRGLLRDPAYNPNLTLDREDFSLNWHRPLAEAPPS